MNADGTIKNQQEQYVEPEQEQPTNEKAEETIKEEYRRRKRRKVHDFNLFKRHTNCDCSNCWKNFALMTVFYFIIIYLLYLIVQIIFSFVDKQEVKTLTTPVIAAATAQK
jgi:hypothetical protein